MKLKVNYNSKEYTLAFNRKTARNMANGADKLSDKDDIVENAGVLLRAALKAEQPNLTKAEATEVSDYIMQNCQLVDKEDENGEIVKGMLSYLNEMITECLPKGFTGQTAEKGFVVAE